MKSTDKFVLVLVASLFLLLAGCGGGGSSSSDEMMSTDGDGMMPTDGDDMTTELDCDAGEEPNAAGDACVPTAETLAAMAAAEKARIDGLTKAIADPDGDDSLEDLTETGRPTLPARTTALGGVVSFGDDKLGVDDKTADGESVEGQFSDPTDAAAIAGWVGTTQSKTADNVMTELVVYSDAEDPKNQAYMMYFGANNASTATPTPDNPRPTIVSAIDVPDGDDDPTNDNAIKDGTLTLAGDNNAALGDERALFGGSIFGFTGSTQSVPGADDGTTDAKENERAGTFAGVPGTFVCGGGAGTPCVLTKNAKGELTGIGTGWTFRPDGTASNIRVQDVVKDADYLIYGYWLETTTKADGSLTYGVNVFAEGSKPFGGDSPTTSVSALVETATYTGDATGLYVEKDFSTGAGVPSAAGQFTADARLTASFGGNAVPVDDQFTISGTVDNFRNTDGDAISGGAWSVNLGKADFSGRTSGTVDGTPGSGHTNTFGGSTNGGGTWTGMFYGPTTADDTDTADVNESFTGYPSGVAGEFNAHFGNGHVVGAFGATR